jgi:putative transposase
MSNHYHLLIETPDPNLSMGMRHLNGVYTQTFNRKHKRNGPDISFKGDSNLLL